MRRYYITDRRALGGTAELLRVIERAVAAGVEMIQIREKDLSTGALFELVVAAVALVKGTHTRVLVNDRLDVALAAGAHGVHLRADSLPVMRVRAVAPAGFLVGVSCHNADEVALASAADFVVLSPVFAKPGYPPPLGLAAFGAIARAAAVPVYALGGVTKENASECLAAGAAGIAGISLFQD